MRLLMCDAQTGLLRALYALAEKALPDVRACPHAMVVETQKMENWASITFNGHRHHIALRLGGAQARQQKLAQALEEGVGRLAWRMSGHYLVDALVTSLHEEEDTEGRVTRMVIEAVTLVED